MFPSEIYIKILKECEVSDIINILLTCKMFNSLKSYFITDIIRNKLTQKKIDEWFAILLYTNPERISKYGLPWLIKAGCNINNQCSLMQGCTALHYAISADYFEIVKMLLKYDTNLNIPHVFNRMYPIHSTAIKDDNENSVKMCKMLLAKNIDINIEEELSGFTALRYAVNHSNSSMVEFLCKQKSIIINTKDKKKGDTPLHISVKSGNFKITKLLLEYGADVNIKNYYGFAPLHNIFPNNQHPGLIKKYNSIIGHPKRQYDIFSLLLSYNADVNVQTEFGMTPLYLAILGGYIEYVQKLLYNGAKISNIYYLKFAFHSAIRSGYYDIVNELINMNKTEALKIINLKDSNDYNSSLHISSYEGFYEISKLLIDNGAFISDTNAEKNTPLHFACKGKNPRLVFLLLFRGADINIVNINNELPIHIACAKGRYTIVEVLLNYNSLLNVKTINKGFTPLHYIAYNNRVNILKLIMNRDEYISELQEISNSQDNKLMTPLHIACENGYTDIVKYLLIVGAKIDIQDENGNYPVNLALDNGHKDIVRILMSHKSFQKNN